MLAELLDKDYNVIETFDLEPQCGKDFCDQCQDCLYCYADWDDNHPCRWVVYADMIPAFKERFGLHGYLEYEL